MCGQFVVLRWCLDQGGKVARWHLVGGVVGRFANLWGPPSWPCRRLLPPQPSPPSPTTHSLTPTNQPTNQPTNHPRILTTPHHTTAAYATTWPPPGRIAACACMVAAVLALDIGADLFSRPMLNTMQSPLPLFLLVGGEMVGLPSDLMLSVFFLLDFALAFYHLLDRTIPTKPHSPACPRQFHPI